MQEDQAVADAMALESSFFAATRSGAYRVLVQGSGGMGLKRHQAIEVIAAFGGVVAPPQPGFDMLAAGPAPSPYRIIQWNEFPPLDVDGEH
jgi:hypothetical protein